MTETRTIFIPEEMDCDHEEQKRNGVRFDDFPASAERGVAGCHCGCRFRISSKMYEKSRKRVEVLFPGRDLSICFISHRTAFDP
jgi:hypothetical protein